MRWAAKDGNAWQTMPVADVDAGDAAIGLEVAAAIGPNDGPTIAFVDTAADRVMVGTRSAGQWTLHELTTAGRNLRLAISGFL